MSDNIIHPESITPCQSVRSTIFLSSTAPSACRSNVMTPYLDIMCTEIASCNWWCVENCRFECEFTNKKTASFAGTALRIYQRSSGNWHSGHTAQIHSVWSPSLERYASANQRHKNQEISPDLHVKHPTLSTYYSPSPWVITSYDDPGYSDTRPVQMAIKGHCSPTIKGT